MVFELNATCIIFIVLFLVFIRLLDAAFLKPVGNVIEERARLIEDDLAAGKQSRSAAQKLIGEYESKLGDIRDQAKSLVAEVTEQGNRKRHAELDRVFKEGQDRLARAQADIAAERSQLIAALVAGEKELISSITRKVLGDESIQVQLDDALIHRSLEEAR
jgi:F-type H+-transporting ATPase subunit b